MERRRPTRATAIRLRDLLAMRDGLAFVENYEIGQVSHVIEMLFGEGKDDMAGYTAANCPWPTSPGPFFNYSSGTTNVLSRIVADHVGYADAYDRLPAPALFGPLGMRSADATFDATGVFVASSATCTPRRSTSRSSDCSTCAAGSGRTRQVISRLGRDGPGPAQRRPRERGTYYSWQWWVTGDAYGTYWASGYEGQMISVVPALDAVVVRFGHTPEEHYPTSDRWRAGCSRSR